MKKMQELSISGSNTVQEVQHAFQEVYPYLKIEFYFPFQAKATSYRKEEQLSGNTVLERYMRYRTAAVIDISAYRTIAELEDDFAHLVGLRVQVFRKSGNLWIITSLTDDWSLGKQNSEGESFSKPGIPKPLEERVEDARFDNE